MATRVRYSMYPDTPVPPDEPYAENPPDGAMIDYFLKRDVELAGHARDSHAGRARRADIFEHRSRRAGEGRRQLARVLVPPAAGAFDEGGTPALCLGSAFHAAAGACSLPISATPHNTKCEPEGIWVQPGQYTATAHGGRQELHPDVHGADGSAREDAGRRACSSSTRFRSRCTMRSANWRRLPGRDAGDAGDAARPLRLTRRRVCWRTSRPDERNSGSGRTADGVDDFSGKRALKAFAALKAKVESP